ncbi:MAG: anti-sigma factor family protein [Planctomycetota bacterium]|jgi:hypothetical protein
MIDERTERLINRKLDGELTETESLELDKLLIRSPQAQALLEEYQQNDTMTAEALQSALSETDTSKQITTKWADSAQPKKIWWRYLTAASAIAAVIVFAVVIKNNPIKQHTPQPTGHIPAQINTKVGDSATIVDADGTQKLTPVLIIEGPRRQKEQIMRDLLGVYDQETNSVYLLEADQTQQTIVPVSSSY